ncbi:MAG TPA: hypothetical protein DCQ56_00450 [Porphyromonadaceae bacterium]|nr:hypothetical protein [Porphyromonadaceae bacterium]
MPKPHVSAPQAANVGLMKMFHRLFLEEAQSMLPVPSRKVAFGGMLCLFEEHWPCRRFPRFGASMRRNLGLCQLVHLRCTFAAASGAFFAGCGGVGSDFSPKALIIKKFFRTFARIFTLY